MRDFQMSAGEWGRACAWVKKHKCHDTFFKQAWKGITGNKKPKEIYYSFYPGSIGTGVSVGCKNCGAEEDITDYERW